MKIFNNTSGGSLSSIGKKFTETHNQAQLDLFNSHQGLPDTCYYKASQLPIMSSKDFDEFVNQTKARSNYVRLAYQYAGLDQYTVIDPTVLLSLGKEYDYMPVDDFHQVPTLHNPHFKRELYWLVNGKKSFLAVESLHRKMSHRVYFAYLHDDHFSLKHSRGILWQQEFCISHQRLQLENLPIYYLHLFYHHRFIDDKYKGMSENMQLQIGLQEQIIEDIARLRLKSKESIVDFVQAVTNTPGYTSFPSSTDEYLDFFYGLRRSIMSGFITGYDKVNKELKWKRPVWADPYSGHIVKLDKKIIEVLSSFI